MAKTLLSHGMIRTSCPETERPGHFITEIDKHFDHLAQ
jgi:hypothetical protein